MNLLVGEAELPAAAARVRGSIEVRPDVKQLFLLGFFFCCFLLFFFFLGGGSFSDISSCYAT